ncbi:MAG TPA: hypothetical protein DCF62_09345, partial [Porticoccaceae bacterium]|nr:hypothetical protein [Porticoccaceae bacterium]
MKQFRISNAHGNCSKSRLLPLLVAIVASLITPHTLAKPDQSYQALRDWIDNARPEQAALEAGIFREDG